MTYTYDKHHEYIDAIRSTWGKRCDGYLAFSNASDLSKSIYSVKEVNGPQTESYTQMWKKTQMIWSVVASSLVNQYDYFLLGGDDLYVIVENLRQLLNSDHLQTLSRNGSNPVYFGRKMRQNAFLYFNAGGAGYVLNAAAVRILYELIATDTYGIRCLPDLATPMEDVMIGFCLRQAGIKPINMQDELGREMFHPVTPAEAFTPVLDWYLDMMTSYGKEANCCSELSISFQSFRPPNYMRRVHSKIYRSS